MTGNAIMISLEVSAFVPFHAPVLLIYVPRLKRVR